MPLRRTCLLTYADQIKAKVFVPAAFAKENTASRSKVSASPAPPAYVTAHETVQRAWVNGADDDCRPSRPVWDGACRRYRFDHRSECIPRGSGCGRPPTPASCTRMTAAWPAGGWVGARAPLRSPQMWDFLGRRVRGAVDFGSFSL